MSFVTGTDNSTRFAPDNVELVDEPRKSLWARYSTLFILAAILLSAAFFRFYGRDFDQGTNQHPDERAIVDRTLQIHFPSSLDQLFDAQSSPLNLRSFGRYPWGALPVYIARGGAWIADMFAPIFNSKLGEDYFLRDYHGVQQVGRSMASIFDLISILLVFLIARRLYSTRTALIAAALVAFSVTNIQIAHFYITEPFMVAFMLAALYFSVVLMQKPSWWAAAFAGLFIGFSIASKVTSALIFMMVIAAILLRAAYRKRSRKLGADLDDPVGMVPASEVERNSTFGRHVRRGLRYVGIAALFSLLGFSISEPYALWQFDFSKLAPQPGQNLSQTFETFMRTNPWGTVIVEEAGIQSGSDQADIPYTRQYVGTVPVLYHFEQLIFWGVGVVPGLLILAGLGLALWLAIKRRPAEIILLSFALPYFATILIGETKWMRYMLPLAVVFSILSAAMLTRGAKWASEKWPKLPRERRGLTVRAAQRNLFPALTVSAIVFAFLWSIAFMNIYTQDHSRVQAGQWINVNLPVGLTISNEGWDDGVPGVTGLVGGDTYRFDLYDDRAIEDELNYIKSKMEIVDVIAITSNRLYGSIPRLPWRYPVQTRFYQLMFAEKLGYVRVHTEHITPEIFGIKIDDQLADESFTVYDHPRVDIFRKVSTLTDDQFRTLFAPALSFPLEEYSVARHSKIDGDKSLMYDTPLNQQPVVGDYSWNPLAQEDTQWIGVALWVLAVYVLGFAAMPLVFVVFRRLPDRGYAFAKLAGLLVTSWIVWMLSSAHLVPFTFWSMILALVVLLAFSGLLWKIGVKYEIRDFMRRKGSLILFYEAIFLISFGFMVFIRMLNPDVWHTTFGGEKTMEFGFLNSALRSPWMPPADPFFGGGYVNYYYHGQFIIGCLIKLVGIDPAIAFNLGLALIYALTFLAAASIVYNIVAWSRARRGSTHEVSGVGMAFAGLAGILVMVIGNFSTIAMWLMVVFPGTTDALLAWGRDLHLVTEGFTRPFNEFYFWPASRVIPGTINEFPYWSYLYGDLHPHLIDMPFTLMVAAIGINLIFAGRYIFSQAALGAGWFANLRARSFSAWQWQWGTGGAGFLTFGFTALALGGLFVTNSWDFPTFAGVLIGATLVALLLSRKAAATDTEGRVIEEHAPEQSLGLGGAFAFALASFAAIGMVAGLSILAYLPFFLNFKAFYTKLGFLVDGGFIPGTGVIMHRTTIWEFGAVWGIFLFVAISYLIVRLWNFPWGAALSDLLGIMPGGQKATVQNSPAPVAAIRYDEPRARRRNLRFPLRRSRRLALTPAYPGLPGSAPLGTNLFFRTESQAEDYATEPEPADNKPSGSGGGEPPLRSLAENYSGSTSDYASALARDSQPAQPNGNEQSQEDNVRALVGELHYPANESEASSRIVPNNDLPSLEASQDDAASDTNGYSTETDNTAPIATANWVADAHIEEQRQRVIITRPATYQPGLIPLWAGFALLAATTAITALQIGTGQPVMALLAALIGGLTATLLSTTRSSAALAGGLMLVVGLIVTLGVEVVYLGDHLAGSDLFRMNTVFKFYMQAWELIALGCGVAVYFILYGLRDRTEPVAAQTIEKYDAPAAVEEVEAIQTTLHEAEEPIADLHTNGATSTNGHEFGEPTVPLASLHPTTNWLVWSTDEIATTDLPTGALPPLEEEPVIGTSAIDIVESMPQLVTRPLHSSAIHSDVEQEGILTGVETVEQMPPLSEDLLTLRWSLGRILWAGLAAVFLFIGFIFPIWATPNKVAMRIQPNTPEDTLSGLSYMQYDATFNSSKAPFPVQMKYDYEGIKWLNKNVPGLAMIAEIPAEYYRDGGMRISSNTGLPMVVGDLHQEEQRGDVYARFPGERRADMFEFYTTPDVQRALTIISKYDIDYIYLGQLEVGYIRNQEATQRISAEAALSKFDQMADPEIGILEKVFQTDNPEGIVGTKIYRVTRATNKDPRTLLGSPVEGSGLPGISITPMPTNTPQPPPTPPVDDPVLGQLIADAAADPTNGDKQVKLFEWYRDNGYPFEAAKVLEVLILRDPTNVALRHQLGDMYNAAGMPDEALKAWEDARDIAPNNPDAHNKVGIAYMDRRRYEEARVEFEAAVAANPQYIESWFHLGQVFEAKGDKNAAISAYQSAIDNSREPNGWQDEAQRRLDQLR